MQISFTRSLFTWSEVAKLAVFFNTYLVESPKELTNLKNCKRTCKPLQQFYNTLLCIFCIHSHFFPEKELLRMVREVSEDRIYDTIEFNEFLQMLSKQQRNYTQDSLRDAFRWIMNPIISQFVRPYSSKFTLTVGRSLTGRFIWADNCGV